MIDWQLIKQQASRQVTLSSSQELNCKLDLNSIAISLIFIFILFDLNEFIFRVVWFFVDIIDFSGGIFKWSVQLLSIVFFMVVDNRHLF